ncbi:hypothetical protein OBBRIDRAFT_812656 [Obba rivulosa]|uniref:F-box domain-containing protein n=1 Tax=Obba rivulosa TaxID=1052685 RepID=A0A8E2DKJ2_9APHY|nr:hypothetical protein OBBRIDRAFT_812656 [Obba rivulosa]
MFSQKTRLCTLPDNVLVHIAVELALIHPLGPPTGLVSLLQVCRHVHSTLRLETNTGFAPNRRIGAHAVHSPNLATQLRKHCIALKHIRSGDIFSESLQDDLWTAYIMLLENDGKNAAQLLEYARVDEDGDQYGGWPPETTVNALAIWICWMTMDEVTGIVHYPYFHSPDNHFDFPISPVFGSTAPLARKTSHGFWHIYRDANAVRKRIIYYGLHLDISSPLVSLGARLLFLTLRRSPSSGGGGLEGHPTKADIAELNANWDMRLYDRGSWDWRSELTTEDRGREDHGVWHKGLKAKSAMWDTDWARTVGCIDPTRLNLDKGCVYALGMLTGLWKGRSTVPILRFGDFPEDACNRHAYDELGLAGHHCVNPEIPIPPGGNGDEHEDGLCNAWFPTDTSFFESNGVVRIKRASTGLISTYETHKKGRPNSHKETAPHPLQQAPIQIPPPLELEQARTHMNETLGEGVDVDEILEGVIESKSGLDDSEVGAGSSRHSSSSNNSAMDGVCRGIQDIIVTGVWGSFNYYGRVRSWDGLIAIVRQRNLPINGNRAQGVHIFRGYIVGGTNFVGLIRACASTIAREAPFVMTKI